MKSKQQKAWLVKLFTEPVENDGFSFLNDHFILITIYDRIRYEQMDRKLCSTRSEFIDSEIEAYDCDYCCLYDGAYHFCRNDHGIGEHAEPVIIKKGV